MRRRRQSLVFVALVVMSCAATSRPHEGVSSGGVSNCVPVGQWVIPASGARPTTPEMVARVASARVVLLGEDHDRPEAHRWQLQMLAALHASRAEMVIGFEMFPRSSQAALDRWVAGELDERDFLLESRWDDVWTLPAREYLPLFRYARMNRVPMVALNVERGLVARVAEVGWEAVPVSEREGVSEPVPASATYAEWLSRIYREHAERGAKGADDEESRARFVQAQLVWDRAFAEALHAATQSHPDALVVGIIGRGHIEHGYGVPWQLAAVGVDDVRVLVPWADTRNCGDLVADVADGVFGVESSAPASERQTMGVMTEAVEGGVEVKHVVRDSPAERAGVRAGDVILEAGGVPVKVPAHLRRVVFEQEPGSRLLLVVKRRGDAREIVVRFPDPS